MHNEQRHFFETVRNYFPEFFEWSSVLEIGSLNINGTIRDYYRDCAYTGVDVGEGECVDLVSFGENLNFRADTFDSVISSELLEHCANWQEVWLNMSRMTRPGGLIVMTCAGDGRPEHGTSRSDVGSSPLTVAAGIEYYENRKSADFNQNLMKDYYKGQNSGKFKFFENKKDSDLYFVGFKYGGQPDGTAFDLMVAELQNWVRDH